MTLFLKIERRGFLFRRVGKNISARRMVSLGGTIICRIPAFENAKTFLAEVRITGPKPSIGEV
jgi:hypothetical protein